MMDIFVNELSFDNQAKPHTVDGLMKQFADVLDLVNRAIPYAEIFIHSSFGSRPLIEQRPISAWLSTMRERMKKPAIGESTEIDSTLYTVSQRLLLKLTQGPYAEELVSDIDALFYLNEINHDLSALSAACYLKGIVVSLGDHNQYPDGKLTVDILHEDGKEKQTEVPNVVTRCTARSYRRRYIPNPKHHPSHSHANASAMEFDRDYDPFTTDKETSLRATDAIVLETRCQYLLDHALTCENHQLYMAVSSGRNLTIYEFQYDNDCGYHGYPVNTDEVPANLLTALKKKALTHKQLNDYQDREQQKDLL